MGNILPTMPSLYNLGARGATPPSFSDTNKVVVGGGGAHRRRQRKALCKKVSRAEECAEYKGNLSVEKIIEFINDSKELIQDFLPPSATNNSTKNINNNITINRQQLHRSSALKESRSKKKSPGSKLSISPEAKTISEDSGLRSDISFVDDNLNSSVTNYIDFQNTDNIIINKSQSLNSFTTVHHKSAAHINHKSSIHNKQNFDETLDKNVSPSDVSNFFINSQDRSTDSSRRRGVSINDSLESFTSMQLSTSSSSLSSTDSTSEQYFSLENRCFYLPQQNDILCDNASTNYEILDGLTNHQKLECSHTFTSNLTEAHLLNASNSLEYFEAFTEDNLLKNAELDEETLKESTNIKENTNYYEDNIDKPANNYCSITLNKEIKFGDVPVIYSLPQEIFTYSNKKVNKNEKVNEFDTVNKKKGIFSKPSVKCQVFFLNTRENAPSFDTSLNFGFNFNETVKLSQNQNNYNNQSIIIDPVSINNEIDIQDSNLAILNKKTNSYCDATLVDERPLSMVRPSQRIIQPDNLGQKLLHLSNDEPKKICDGVSAKRLSIEQDKLLNIYKDNGYWEFGRIGLNDKIKKEKSTDCDSALIPMLCVHG